MYDELINNYGKVVFSRKDKKPASAEIDDDAESLSCKLKEVLSKILLPHYLQFCSFQHFGLYKVSSLRIIMSEYLMDDKLRFLLICFSTNKCNCYHVCLQTNHAISHASI